MEHLENTMAEEVSLLNHKQPTEEIARIVQAMVNGRLDERCDAVLFSGDERILIDQINGMLDTLIAPLHLAAHAIEEIAHGRIPDFVIEEYKGEYNHIKQNLNTLLATLYGMHKETQSLISSIKEGRLNARGNDWDFHGNWKKLIGGVNETLDAVIDPVREASNTLGELSEYNLDARMHGKYHGDHAIIKKALNKTGESLSGAISKVSESVTSLRVAINQISEKIGAVTAGAAEQSVAIEKTSENLMQISATFQEAASTTEEAKRNVHSAGESMVTAKDTMERMREAMDEIRSASDSTAAIVHEINEITKQTDVLASSAAGKAAKVRASAGGFGVVAKEIRRLSIRCDEAANTLKSMMKTNAKQQSSDNNDNDQLQQIIADLDEIAMLSNYLGVNAAIEAAHVEAAGQAFEALTGEVRQLAQRSADSAKKTEVLINQSVELAKKGQTITLELDEHFDAAVQATQDVGRMTEEIATATSEGAFRLEEINRAVLNIDAVTKQNVTSAQEATDAIHRLEEQSGGLEKLVKKFHF